MRLSVAGAGGALCDAPGAVSALSVTCTAFGLVSAWGCSLGLRYLTPTATRMGATTAPNTPPTILEISPAEDFPPRLRHGGRLSPLNHFVGRVDCRPGRRSFPTAPPGPFGAPDAPPITLPRLPTGLSAAGRAFAHGSSSREEKPRGHHYHQPAG